MKLIQSLEIYYVTSPIYRTYFFRNWNIISSQRGGGDTGKIPENKNVALEKWVYLKVYRNRSRISKGFSKNCENDDLHGDFNQKHYTFQ